MVRFQGFFCGLRSGGGRFFKEDAIMTLSKGAVGNLVNRYRAVLKKCHLMNVFGSLAVAALITMGGSVALAASDVAYEGALKDNVVGEGGKAIGGWNFTQAGAMSGDHSTASSNITATSGAFDEIIGGNHIKQPAGGTQESPVLVSIGNTQTTINGTSGVQYIIGGSKANNAHVMLNNGATSLTITGGSDLAVKGMVIGGSYVKATGNPGGGTAAVSTAETASTTVSISGGTFGGSVIGGSAAHDYTTYPGAQGTVSPQLSVTDGDTNVIISGGSFAKTEDINAAVVGGGLALGKGAASTVTGTSTLTVTGGTFGGNIHAGGAAVNGGTASVANSVLNIEDGANKISGLNAVYGGGLDSGVSGSLTTNIKGLVTGTPDSKTGIYGGSKAAADNLALKDGSVVMNVSDSTLCADIRGGGGAFGAGSSSTTDSSTLQISNTTVSGYESGTNIWTGRIFGAGIAQGKDTLVKHGSSSVTIENVTGVTYDKETGELSKEDGARVYGGGQAYRVGGGEKVFVDSAKVIVKGEKTSLAEVYGGSIVSGTSKPETSGLVVLGKSDVSVEGGTVIGYVVGGNNTNWFGRSVVGKQDDQGAYAFNGKNYSAGSTKVTISGGDVSQALVAGGSLSDYGWYYNQNGVRESAVFGTTDVTVSGGKAGTVIGGGIASYYNTETLAESGKQRTDASPSSFVEGKTSVTVSGGEVGDIIGGGFAQSNQKDLPAFAEVKGDSTVSVTGGTVSGSIFGGGMADGEDTGANVTGNTSIIISGGELQGDIYAGGAANGTGSTADVEGSATVTFLNGSTFTNAVHGQGKGATVTGDSILVFGNLGTGYTGIFEGSFDGFNFLNVTSGSSVTLAKGLDNASVGDGLKLNGAGTVISDVTLSDAKKLEVANGTLQSSNVALAGNSNLAVSGGVLRMAENGVLSFADTAHLTLTGGAANLYKDMVLDNSYNTLSGIADAIVGTSGNLNIFLGGAEYTAEQYNAAKDGLFTTNEKAMLNFLDGTLKVQEGEQVVIGGGVTDDKVTLSGVVPVVAKESEAAGEAGAKIDSVPDRFIQVVAADDANKTLLTASSLEVKDSTFSAKGLQINPTDAASGVNLAVTGGANLTLVGGDTVGSSVIIDESGSAVKTQIEIDGGATLNLGIAGNTANQMASLDSLDVRNGTVNVNGNGLDTTQHTYGELAVSHEDAAVNFSKATVVAQKTTLGAGSVSVTDNTAALFAELEVQNGSLQILNSTAHVENLGAKGGTLFVDPAYVKVENLSDGAFGSSLLVGDGSVVEIGSIAELQAKAAEAGLNPAAFGSGFTVASGESMLALGKPVTLGAGGKIVVDAGVDKSGKIDGKTVSGSAYFGGNSLLVVDSAIASGGGAIKANSRSDTITVKKGAKLYLVDAKANGDYTVASNFADASLSVEGWTGSDLVTNRLINAERIAGTNGTVKIKTTAKQASALYPGISIPNTLDRMIEDKQNDVDSGNAGIKFLSRALEPQFLAEGEVLPTIDGAAQLAYAGGVQASTVAVAQAPVRAIQSHLSLAGNVAQKGTSLHENGFDLWANAIYGADRARDFSAGGLDAGYNSDFAGGVIGGDWTFDAGAGKGRVGLALNVGAGDTKSRGDFNSTKNDFDFWGVSLYGGWNMDNVNVVADLGYSVSKNELKQDIPSSLGLGGRIKGDVDSSVITAGVKAEYMIKTDVLDVMPHVGVRYLAVKTDSFSTKLDQGGDLFRTDGDLQHVWQFPVGVNLSKSFETESGWKIKPQADLSVVPAAGDTKTKIDVRTPGVDASDSMKRRVMDTTSFDVVFGVEVQKDNVSFGLGYNVQASEHQTGQGVTASFMYKF